MSAIDKFVDWAYHCLIQSDEAVQYLQGRGVSQEQMARHRLGYVAGDYFADPSYDTGHDPSACDDKPFCDSCRLNRWSSLYENRAPVVGRRIVGHVVLPLTSYSGTLVGFQVRSISKKSYDSFMTSYRPEGYFFGLAPNVDHIWSSKEVTLVEGPFDQLIFERLVARNVLSLTTSAIGSTQSKFLRRFVCNANMCLDLDAAGRHGVKMAKKRLVGIHVRDVRFPSIRPGDKDISNFWEAVGDDKFSSYFKRQIRNLI